MLELLEEEIIGAGGPAASLRRFVEGAATSSESVTLTGEAGTGKQLAAMLIHQKSSRREGPFLMIDCSLYYERELKRELFGYVRGGLDEKSCKGILEFASRGTCYLSRIEELSQGIQGQLVEFLETRQFTRLGDGKRVSSGVRLIASSEKNLEGFVQAGLMNAELYKELSRLNARLPPLRERKEDIGVVVDYWIERFREELGTEAPARLSAEALEALQAYPWPGNFDDLKKEISGLVEGGVRLVRPEHLSTEIAGYWLGQRGDPDVRRALQELDGYIKEFCVLSRLEPELGQVFELDSPWEPDPDPHGRNIVDGI